MYAASWNDLKGVLLTERTQSQKVTFYLLNILVKKKLQIKSASCQV